MGVFKEEAKRHRDRGTGGRQPQAHLGTDWTDASISQKVQRNSGKYQHLEETREDSCLEFSEGTWSCSTLTSDAWTIHVCCPKSPSVWLFVQKTQGKNLPPGPNSRLWPPQIQAAQPPRALQGQLALAWGQQPRSAPSSAHSCFLPLPLAPRCPAPWRGTAQPTQGHPKSNLAHGAPSASQEAAVMWLQSSANQRSPFSMGFKGQKGTQEVRTPSRLPLLLGDLLHSSCTPTLSQLWGYITHLCSRRSGNPEGEPVASTKGVQPSVCQSSLALRWISQRRTLGDREPSCPAPWGGRGTAQPSQGAGKCHGKVGNEQ